MELAMLRRDSECRRFVPARRGSEWTARVGLEAPAFALSGVARQQPLDPSDTTRGKVARRSRWVL